MTATTTEQPRRGALLALVSAIAAALVAAGAYFGVPWLTTAGEVIEDVAPTIGAPVESPAPIGPEAPPEVPADVEPAQSVEGE